MTRRTEQTLKRLVGQEGIGAIIQALSDICHEKASRLVCRTQKSMEAFERGEESPIVGAWMDLYEGLEGASLGCSDAIACVEGRPPVPHVDRGAVEAWVQGFAAGVEGLHHDSAQPGNDNFTQGYSEGARTAADIDAGRLQLPGLSGVDRHWRKP